LALAGPVDEAAAVGDELLARLSIPEDGTEVHLLLAHAAVAASRWPMATHHLEMATKHLVKASDGALEARAAVLQAEVALANGEADRARRVAGDARRGDLLPRRPQSRLALVRGHQADGGH
jgi:hypothetical protein